MINIKTKNCQHPKCKELKLYGMPDKVAQFCFEHKQPEMINIDAENACDVPDCTKEHMLLVDGQKFCLAHSPKEFQIKVNRLCKYCDIEQESDYICGDCKKISTKKEWAIVRHLRKTIDTKFEYNSSKMLQGCSKKRPDVFFDLPTHCVIVEVDENQHKPYEDTCECARINEIVNGIGGRSVIFIRFNPDGLKHQGNRKVIKVADRLPLLVKTIKSELIANHESFKVKTIQLYYDCNLPKFVELQEEDITDRVCC